MVRGVGRELASRLISFDCVVVALGGSDLEKSLVGSRLTEASILGMPCGG